MPLGISFALTSHSHRPPSTLSGRPLSKSKLYFFDCSTRVFCSSRLTNLKINPVHVAIKDYNTKSAERRNVRKPHGIQTNLRFSSWSTGPKRARFTREVSGSAGGAARGRFPLSPPFPPPAPPSPLEPDGFLLKFCNERGWKHLFYWDIFRRTRKGNSFCDARG